MLESLCFFTRGRFSCSGSPRGRSWLRGRRQLGTYFPLTTRFALNFFSCSELPVSIISFDSCSTSYCWGWPIRSPARSCFHKGGSRYKAPLGWSCRLVFWFGISVLGLFIFIPVLHYLPTRKSWLFLFDSCLRICWCMFFYWFWSSKILRAIAIWSCSIMASCCS